MRRVRRCTEIDGGRFIDLIELDAASNTQVDNMRDLLENALYAPTRARFKVYIIDEVHMLSRSAFNAMLKTLEEPPEHVKFVLATTDPQKVPVTVLSRCLQFNLKQIPAPQIRERLEHILQQEGIASEASALNLIARAAQGSLRDALSLLDQAIAHGAGRVEEQSVRAMLGTVDQSFLFALLDAVVAARWRRAAVDGRRNAGAQLRLRDGAAGSGGIAASNRARAVAAPGDRSGRSGSRCNSDAGRYARGGRCAALLSDRAARTRRFVVGAGRIRRVHHAAAAHAGVCTGGKRHGDGTAEARDRLATRARFQTGGRGAQA